MAMSTTSQRALFALKQSSLVAETAVKILGVRFVSSKLGNSMSDGVYDGNSLSSADRPNSSDSNVVRARAAQSSMTDPGHDFLANSLSDGMYQSRSMRRVVAPALSSITDPETFWAGSSMSDGYYEMPNALRASSRSMKPKQAHRSAGPQSLPLMQRIKTNSYPPSSEGRLHDSYSATGY